MKTKSLLFSLCILFLSVNISFSQNTYIPDDNFEQALIDLGYDSGELNDSVPTVNIESVLTLDIDSKNINDLTGIEDFVNLEGLSCKSNQLVSLNLENNLKLKNLLCSSNQLIQLDISKNSQLQYLDCVFNSLTVLKLSTSIIYLDCSTNQLSELELGNNTNIQTLYCPNNLLIDLDLSSYPSLEFIFLDNNKLTGLNLENSNNIIVLDVTNNPDLLCIQVENPVAAYKNSNWIKNGYTAYSEDCASFVMEMTYIPDNNFE